MTTAILVIESVVLVLLAVLVVGLLRSHADILRQLHELGLTDPSSPSPATRTASNPRPRLNANPPSDIQGESLRGSAIHVGVSGNPGLTLLAFMSTGCSACMGLWDELRTGVATDEFGETRLVVVAKSLEAESPSRLEELSPPNVKLVLSTKAWEDYGVPVSPYFVLVDGSSGEVVGEGSSTSWAQVRSLMGQALTDKGVLAGADLEAGEFRADAELRRAGVGPGHPTLYPEEPPIAD